MTFSSQRITLTSSESKNTFLWTLYDGLKDVVVRPKPLKSSSESLEDGSKDVVFELKDVKVIL
jgi:hypothetical protein